MLGLVAAGATIGCSSDDVAAPVPPPASAPRITSAVVLSNPYNALSAFVAVAAEPGDSARVLYRGVNQALDSTPYTPLTAGADTIVTLGLAPDRAYAGVVEVVGAGGTARSDSVSFTAGPLPEPFQHLTITTTGSGGPGLTLTSLQLGGAAVFALAFDSAGTIRWYRQFEGTEPFGGELKQQANGDFTLYRGASTGVEPTPGYFVEFTAAGDSVRAISAAPPRYIDNHELWITPGDGGEDRFHYFTYDRRSVDLRPVGGGASVSLAGHQLVRVRPDGSTEFEWNAWDHLSFDEWIEPPGPEPGDSIGRDFDHPNALAFDRDGNYVVSFRSLGQILKLNRETGEVVWRLGGLRNEFTFANDPLEGFSAQHSVRVLPNGNVLLYDNGTRHQPAESRAVEYALDTTAMTATMVWQFRHQPVIYTSSLGLVQRLRNGSTVVGYDLIGRVLDVDAAGGIRWEAELKVDAKPALVYRTVRIASLYRYLEP
jgi:outer membrane protein assembly factor BamB